MITITEDFLKEETRLGFIIPETMKKVWAVQLELLEQILSIAKNHSIPIWADYGTLLGAVRHNGFIPWDDDIDLCMLRKDYTRFLHILQSELPSNNKVISFYTSEDYDQPKGYVANRYQLDFGNSKSEAEITKSQYGIPYINGIDIFPLDYLPSSTDQLDIISNLYISAYDLAFNFDLYKSSGELEVLLTQLEGILNTHIERNAHLKTSIWKLSDAIAAMTYEDESSGFARYARCAVDGFSKKRQKQSYSHTIYMNFEMLQIPVPEGYDDVLRAIYGDNYMMPMRGTAWHDYPFYKAQDRRILFHNMLGQIGDIF